MTTRKRLPTLGLGDPLLFALVAGLSIFGILKIYSAGVLDVPSSIVPGLWRMQLLWFTLALLLLPVVLRVPIRLLEALTVPLYALAVLLLVLTPIIGTGAGTAEGVPRWVGIGPARIQTAEFAKVPVILMLAKVLSGWRLPPESLLKLWQPVIVVLIPMALVMLQPDIGTTIVFAGILLAALFWAGVPLRLLLLLISPGLALVLSFHTWLWGTWIVLLAVLLYLWKPPVVEASAVLLANIAAGTIALTVWNRLADYQKNRILVFLDPSIDPRGAGYNLIQSQVALGSGGPWGKGFTQGTQKRLAFLPEQHTDFIFAVVGEELGFLGVAVVLVAFGLIFFRIVQIAVASLDAFGSVAAFGIFASWFIHVIVNTGMTVGVMPITGIPLPFVSYGGSFLLVNLLAMGVLQRIAAEARQGL